MKTRNGMGRMGVALLSGGLVLAPLTAVAGGPVGATLQTEGNAGLAVATGNLLPALPAKLSMVVTRPDGRPASNLGQSGDELPSGWGLASGFNGGCGMTPTAFVNHSGGIYTIEVMPACGAWVAGEQHYVVSLSKNGRKGGNGGGNQGNGGGNQGNGGGNQGNLSARTLGTLEVPSAP